MSREPFARITRRQRWQARLARTRRLLARPLRPRRIRPGRPGPPNLLLVGVDTLRADHLGCGGCPRPVSPRIDALAARGTIFRDVTSASPWTLPSFASALSGVMPGLHGGYLAGAVRNMDTQPPRRLDPQVATLATHLRSEGYATAAFYSNQFFAFGLAETFASHEYHNLSAEDLADVAADWIGRHADRPFFCFVLFNDPHEPTTPPTADLQRFLDTPPAAELLAGLARWGEPPAPDLGRCPLPLDAAARSARDLKLAIYAATVHQVDRAVGGLQDRLEAWGLDPVTLISLFSDHGEEFLDHADEAARWRHDPRGLHGVGHGHTHFQELLHVPWLAWGAGVPAGLTVATPVSLLDLAPTLADWLGVPPFHPERAEPGVRAGALSDSLVGRAWSSGAAGDSGDDGRLLCAEAIAYGPDLVMLRQGRWKLIAHRDGRPLALYDLQVDPGETRDRAADAPDVVAELGDALGRWRASGCGATGRGDGPDSWTDLDDTVRQRLRDLGYSE